MRIKIVSHSPSDIRLGSMNINGTYDNPGFTLTNAYRRHHWYCPSRCTRSPKYHQPYQTTNQRCVQRHANMGPHWTPSSFPLDMSYHSLVGGQIIILLGSETVKCQSHQTDPFKLGIYLSLELVIRDPTGTMMPRRLYCISCYFPHSSSWSEHNPHSGGLHSKLATALIASNQIQPEHAHNSMRW